MKLEDMIMVVENRKGTETNYLLNLTDYMEAALKLWGEHAEDMAGGTACSLTADFVGLTLQAHGSHSRSCYEAPPRHGKYAPQAHNAGKGTANVLYGTKAGKADWSDLYIAANKSIHASFCGSEPQLREFLSGRLSILSNTSGSLVPKLFSRQSLAVFLTLSGSPSFCSGRTKAEVSIDTADVMTVESRLAEEIQARQGQLEAQEMPFKECMELSKE